MPRCFSPGFKCNLEKDFLDKPEFYARSKIKQLNLVCRVACRDNQPYDLTDEHNPDRINLYIKTGKINKITWG